MTQDEFTTWALGRGWELDSFGHFKKKLTRKRTGTLELYRYKIGKYSVRYETQVVYEDGKKSWVRIASGYYKNLTINAEGRLQGMVRQINPPTSKEL